MAGFRAFRPNRLACDLSHAERDPGSQRRDCTPVRGFGTIYPGGRLSNLCKAAEWRHTLRHSHMTTELTPQQEILQVAAECFMEQGFNATSIDDVARRMNATKGRIYHYYASKTDLFFEINREGMDRSEEHTS